jgi:molybdopterin-guanine dinucleotide biosynthesis protein B
VHRIANAKPFLYEQDPAIVAIATDANPAAPVPVFALDDIAQIADMMLAKAVHVDAYLSLDGAGA